MTPPRSPTSSPLSPRSSPLSSPSGAPLLVEGRQHWVHVPVRRHLPLHRLPHARLDAPATQALLGWVIGQGSRCSTELRLCGSGRHGGVWLGLRGRGATQAHADYVSEELRLRLQAFLRLNRWHAKEASPPPLPRWSAGLCFSSGGGMVGSADGLASLRRAVVEQAERGAPLLLRMRLNAHAILRSVYGPADAMLRRLRTASAGPSNPLLHHQAEMIRQLQDDAAGLSLRVQLCSARSPSSMRLRTLSHAFAGVRLRAPWRAQGTPTLAETSLLRSGLSLLVGREDR